jgi:predicted glycosyltransferase
MSTKREGQSMNVYILSQHSLGVGHLSRTSLLASEMAKTPGVSVVHISCGPPVGIIPSHPDVSLVELPPLVVKGMSSTELVPLETGKTREDVEKVRVDTIAALFRERRPDMFITEFFPFSPHRLDGTVLPVLGLIKKTYPDCAILCSSRDIPICHREVIHAGLVARITSILDTYYDLLLVHSDPAVVRLMDIPKYRALKPSCPVVYTGYICERRETAPHPASTVGRRILVTVGGGRDGYRVVESAVTVAARKGGYWFDIVCGPFMEKGRVDEMDRRAGRLSNTRLFRSVHNLRETIGGYDLVICSGGYNTLIETIIRRKRCISIPRAGSYEQAKRVGMFSAKGLVAPILESRLTARGLSRLIEEVLAADYRPAAAINTDGLKNTLAVIRHALSSGVGGIPVPGTTTPSLFAASLGLGRK